METWFIRHNNESLGPYSIGELKNLSVAKDDYVWKEGLPDWVQAGSVPELKQLFNSAAPPPFTGQSNTGKLSYEVSESRHSYFAAASKPVRSRRRLLWISVLLILSLVTYLVYANNNTR